MYLKFIYCKKGHGGRGYGQKKGHKKGFHKHSGHKGGKSFKANKGHKKKHHGHHSKKLAQVFIFVYFQFINIFYLNPSVFNFF